MMSKKIFIFLLLSLPLNLGKHFVVRDSYVGGLLVDYLIPTIYIQDILCIFLVFSWLVESFFLKNKNGNTLNPKPFFKRKEVFLSIFLIFCVFLSVLTSYSFIPSLYAFIRLLLYFLVFLYVLKTKPKYFYEHFVFILGVWVFLLGVLAVLQYIGQGSFFDNYLLFGEQVYRVSTPGIVRENIFGFTRVPAYGLFRHPNIFGGFLAISLVWLIPLAKKHRLFKNFLVFGFLALVLTFSYFSLVCFGFGVLMYKFFKWRKIGLVFSVAFFVSLFLMPIISVKLDVKNPSISKRSDLMMSTYKLIKEKPVFGVGFNNNTVLIEKNLALSTGIRFVQPVHNIFLLLFSESGFLTFSVFVLLFIVAVKHSYNDKVMISVLQIILLGSFDHYFLTIHQTHLFMWLVLSLVWTKRLTSEYN